MGSGQHTSASNLLNDIRVGQELEKPYCQNTVVVVHGREMSRHYKYFFERILDLKKWAFLLFFAVISRECFDFVEQSVRIAKTAIAPVLHFEEKHIVFFYLHLLQPLAE